MDSRLRNKSIWEKDRSGSGGPFFIPMPRNVFMNAMSWFKNAITTGYDQKTKKGLKKTGIWGTMEASGKYMKQSGRKWGISTEHTLW